MAGSNVEWKPSQALLDEYERYVRKEVVTHSIQRRCVYGYWKGN